MLIGDYEKRPLSCSECYTAAVDAVDDESTMELLSQCWAITALCYKPDGLPFSGTITK